MFKQGPLETTSEAKRGAGNLLTPPTAVNYADDEQGIVLGPAKGLVNVESSDPCAGGALLGVCLGLQVENNEVFRAPQVGAINPHVIGKAEWGIGTANFEAEFDWVHGSVLSIPTENLRISARYAKQTRPWDPTLDATWPSFFVSAGAAYSSSGHNSNPARRTYLVQLETTGDFFQIAIPPFAISFTVVSISGNDLQAVLTAFGDEYETTYDFAMPPTNAGQHNVENSFPIPNGAQFLRIQAPADDTFAYVIFGLAI